MHRHALSFTAVVLAHLAAHSGILVQAISKTLRFSPPRLDAFSQAHSGDRLDSHNGIAFISGRPVQGTVRTYEEIAERMKRRREANERRQRDWEQAQAARNLPEPPGEAPHGYEPSQTLHKQYGRARTRRHPETRRRGPTGEEQGRAEDTAVVYKNTIRACLLSGKVHLHDFCRQTGSIAECEKLLRAFVQTNTFEKLKFGFFTYTVSLNGRFYTTTVPLFQTFVLKFLAQLDYSLSHKCSYDTETLPLVLLSFEDAIDPSVGGGMVWNLSRSSEGGALSSAVGAVKKAFSIPVPKDYLKLYEIAAQLTTFLVQAGSMRNKFPLLARALNFLCRSRRICRSVADEIVRASLGTVDGATAGFSVESSPLLTEELEKILSAIFNGRLNRLARYGAAVLSGWLTQCTKAMLEPESGRQ